MKLNEEGFLYPIVDETRCVKCKKCEEICPAIVQGKERKPLKVYAAKNPDDEIRIQSSSGGIFSLLAEYIINEGGVVFGARFNDKWEVVHDYAETKEGLEAFRGSKYVQSRINDTYKLTKDFLSAGKKVLFTGTPCQIAGLKAYLQKEYDNLLTVDLVCHGVPSPLVWKKYLDEIVLPFTKNNANIVSIKFRDKSFGWKEKGFRITFIDAKGKTFSFLESRTKNLFRKAFWQICIYVYPVITVPQNHS
jgi:coenzyme F420-reducing hydrogenase beta subunit